MHKRFQALRIFAVMTLFLTACETWLVQAQPREQATPKAIEYQTLLGKWVSDKEVADFIANNHCSPAEKFQLCKEAGIALWTDSNQIVRTVYLYAGHGGGFKRYRGELPFGLTFYDPMWLVEEKLRDLEADDASQPASKAGLPDEGSSPDHFHYWAVYKRFGMTIIYDTPFADEDAYIYAVLVNNLASEE